MALRSPRKRRILDPTKLPQSSDRWPPGLPPYWFEHGQILYIALLDLSFLHELPPMKEFGSIRFTTTAILTSVPRVYQRCRHLSPPQGQQCLRCWRCHAWAYLGLRLLAEGCLHWWHGGGCWGWLDFLDQFRGNWGNWMIFGAQRFERPNLGWIFFWETVDTSICNNCWGYDCWDGLAKGSAWCTNKKWRHQVTSNAKLPRGLEYFFTRLHDSGHRD